MSGPRWAISPTDGQAHLLLPAVDQPPGALQAWCGHLLPLGVVQHERLPGQRLCQTCFWFHLLPEEKFSQFPAGRRSSSPVESPGGQPVPDPAGVDVTLSNTTQRGVGCCPFGSAVQAQPRWARCPVDQHLHLLVPGEVAVAATEGYGQAVCGRWIHAGALTWAGPSLGLCAECLTAGFVR